MKKAFTLVEVLICIVIIGILLVILLPGLSKSRTFSKNMVCESNLRQHITSWTMYSDSYKESFPVAEDLYERNVRWMWGGILDGIDDDQFNSFTLSTDRPVNSFYEIGVRGQIFECPLDVGTWYFDTKIPTIWHEQQEQPSVARSLGTSYFTNDWLYCRVGSARGFDSDVAYQGGRNYTESNKIHNVISSASRFIVLGDAGQMDSGRYNDEEKMDRNIVFANWHGDHANNFAFLDGSVRQEQLDGTIKGQSYGWYLDERKHKDGWYRRCHAN